MPFEEQLIDLADKSDEFKDMYRSIATDPNATAKVPIIELGEAGSPEYMKMVESGVVTDFIAQYFRGVGPDLLPKEPWKEAKMRYFIQIFMETFQRANMAFMTASSESNVKMEHKKLMDGLKAVNDTLEKHGEQGAGADAPFFFGSQYTVAEALTVPFVPRMQALFQEHRDVDLGLLINELGFSALGKWWKAVMERPSTLLTTPGFDILKQMAPYVRPVFTPYKFTGAETAEAIASKKAEWAAGGRAAMQEAKVKANLARGMAMQGQAGSKL